MALSKKAISDLAIFGGNPSFAAPIIFGKPNVPDIDGVMKEIRSVLDSGVLSNNGPRVQAFEKAVAGLANTKHCIVTDNATSALQILARALNLQGNVIMPAFTFIATANAFAWQGIRPVFVDVDPATHTIDVRQAEAAITPDTSGICGVHLWGNLCDNTSLSLLAERHNLALVYDSAHAIGCEDASGFRVGGFGHAEIFSFHATKFLNAFEGGAVVTNDDDLAERLRRIRNFGFDKNGRVETIGINAKMSEVSAVMGLHSLRHYEEIVSVNRRNSLRYRCNLEGRDGVTIVAPENPQLSNCQYVVADVDEQSAGISRDVLLTCLRAEGVLAKAYFVPPCHLQEAYKSGITLGLPVSERLAQRICCLPNGVLVGDQVVDRICELISSIVNFGADIERVLNKTA